ncbi:MAG TPA: riboflavin synthase [Gemmatimonadaceae bacterium]|nr:riboflavin synthase [Gemmatimonadaceae bacterium]
MFTGLVDDVGTVERVANSAAGRELRVRCRYLDLVPGESVALDGACLTVRECGPGWFVVAAVETTLERTTIGEWRVGRRVNLERALRFGDRLGGHLVLGHVDGVALVRQIAADSTATVAELQLPAGLAELMVPHGSLTVDGVSLTVNSLPAPDTVEISLIDFTRVHTTLGELVPGRRVHVEADVIGKYVQRLAAPYVTSGRVS